MEFMTQKLNYLPSISLVLRLLEVLRIFDLLNLVVLGEVEGKCDDVLHGVPRRKEEFSNVDCRSHPS